MRRLAVVVRPPVSLAVTVHVALVGRPASVFARGKLAIEIRMLTFDQLKSMLKEITSLFKTVLSSGYILILLSIENILACLIEMRQGWSRMRNVN